MNYNEWNEERFFKFYHEFLKTGVISNKYDDILFVRSDYEIAVHSTKATGIQIPLKDIKKYLTKEIINEIGEYGVWNFKFPEGKLESYYKNHNISLPDGFTQEDLSRLEKKEDVWLWYMFVVHAGLNPKTFGF